MKKPYLLTVTVLILCAVLSGPLLLSCSNNDDSSLINQLDSVDSYIRVGQTEEAFSLLKKASKKAFTPYAKIGIYKRFILLGEDEFAEKVLKKARKEFPDNNEIIALYTHFMLRHDRVTEALEFSRKLSGTEFSSLYAEAVLKAVEERGADCLSVFVPKKKYKLKKLSPNADRKTVAKQKEEASFAKKNIYRDSRMTGVYEDAWRSSKMPLWLRNSASLKMKNGTYDEAVFLLPEKCLSCEDALFWGTVCYDASLYAESVTYLLESKKPLPKENSFSAKFEYLEQEIAALASDCYYILGEEDAAEAERQIVIASTAEKLPVYTKEAMPPVLCRIVPPVYIDSANYAALHDDVDGEYRTLVSLMEVFPEYAPALASYGRMALENYYMPSETWAEQELRESGLKTIKMEKKDALPKVSVEEVLSRIENQLADLSDPQIIVLKEQLNEALDNSLSKAEKVSHVWTFLENHQVGKNLYPAELMHYAVTQLLASGDKSDAHVLFEKYMNSTYSADEKIPFAPLSQPSLLKLWEIETSAWFAAGNLTSSESRSLYSYIIEKFAARTPALCTGGEQNTVINAFINLAEINRQCGKEKEALDLLNKASARVTDSRKKAEIIYRMAEISAAGGDVNSALLSLKYVLKLNPEHNNAQLLLNKLN